MSAGGIKCLVCGGPLELIKIRPKSLGHLTTYKCTCPRCQGGKESTLWPLEAGRRISVLGGFEELPSEPVAIVHHETG
jgi:hypothetical protein